MLSHRIKARKRRRRTATTHRPRRGDRLVVPQRCCARARRLRRGRGVSSKRGRGRGPRRAAPRACCQSGRSRRSPAARHRAVKSSSAREPCQRSVILRAATFVSAQACRSSVLQRALAAVGLYYPPVPTFDGAFVGGTIATNAAGAATFKHGSTRRWVDAATIVLANGDVLDVVRGRDSGKRRRLVRNRVDDRCGAARPRASLRDARRSEALGWLLRTAGNGSHRPLHRRGRARSVS